MFGQPQSKLPDGPATRAGAKYSAPFPLAPRPAALHGLPGLRCGNGTQQPQQAWFTARRSAPIADTRPMACQPSNASGRACGMRSRRRRHRGRPPGRPVTLAAAEQVRERSRRRRVLASDHDEARLRHVRAPRQAGLQRPPRTDLLVDVATARIHGEEDDALGPIEAIAEPGGEVLDIVPRHRTVAPQRPALVQMRMVGRD